MFAPDDTFRVTRPVASALCSSVGSGPSPAAASGAAGPSSRLTTLPRTRGAREVGQIINKRRISLGNERFDECLTMDKGEQTKKCGFDAKKNDLPLESLLTSSEWLAVAMDGRAKAFIFYLFRVKGVFQNKIKNRIK